LKEQKRRVLFITDKSFVEYTIPGGIQLCTAEFIEYLTAAGYAVDIFRTTPSVTFIKKLKRRLNIEAYEMYDIGNQLEEIAKTINDADIKLILFNQVNLAHWSESIKSRVKADVKFVGLSHGNESGDYLHEVTQSSKTSLLKTWRLGRLIVKEKAIFSRYLDGVITISDNETYIDQWLGARKIFFLPRILKPGFVDWKPQLKTIGFVGTLNHLPNLAGIEMLADQLQLQGFDGIMKVVGAPEHLGRSLEKKYKFIQYCGQFDDAQLARETATWSVFLNPVFWYARGSSTKLSKALNCGLPVLTTPAGARGYELSNGNIITKDNLPHTLAETVLKTLASPVALSLLKQASEENASNFNINNWTGKLSGFLNSI
jgi:glycosyltransferase involved in cell wall biosynthesis